MNRLVIANAFSLNMLPKFKTAFTRLSFFEVENPEQYVKTCIDSNIDVKSIVGHWETSNIFSVLLNYHVLLNRETYKIEEGDLLLVGQYTGPRLEEGAMELPEGSSIRWITVNL